MKWKYDDTERFKAVSIYYANNNHAKQLSKAQILKLRNLINDFNEQTREQWIGCNEWWIECGNGSETLCIILRWSYKHKSSMRNTILLNLNLKYKWNNERFLQNSVLWFKLYGLCIIELR